MYVYIALLKFLMVSHVYNWSVQFMNTQSKLVETIVKAYF